uniref:NitT/TauT family transport system substrate-binding protein n=1 Tax=Candidatus Kentrum sp. SD TaxID=2126332 RepID=A0A450Y698_9GAMM|nr:MAG: NitT/TauT family transport system substrate-binding protein [Candidatus Kentron sp. SD]VFK43119.1 MAG: NitT/TauT family transport system substrate-binding protein [Candidatus Kentron sp. SD]
MNIFITRRGQLISSALIAFVLVMGVAAIAAGFLGTANRSTPPVKVGYIPITHCIPLYLAIEKGIFARKNMEVELIALPGGPKILEALIAGEVDVGFSNVASVILARNNGIGMLPIAGGALETEANRDHAILVKRDSSISSAADLRGRKIAINSRQNIDHLMMRAYLDKYALTEDDVALVEIPFPRMNAALEGGLVDAIATVEPFATLGVREYNREILTYNYLEVRDRTLVTTFAAMKGNVSRDPALYERFARAIREASEIANRDPVASRSVLPEYTRITPALAEIVGLPYFSPSPDEANMARTEEMMIRHGFIRERTNPAGTMEGGSGAKP